MVISALHFLFHFVVFFSFTPPPYISLSLYIYIYIYLSLSFTRLSPSSSPSHRVSLTRSLSPWLSPFHSSLGLISLSLSLSLSASLVSLSRSSLSLPKPSTLLRWTFPPWAPHWNCNREPFRSRPNPSRCEPDLRWALLLRRNSETRVKLASNGLLSN